ncbi:MAG: ATP-binding protein [Candidatus Hydrogenedentota bacterium]
MSLVLLISVFVRLTAVAYSVRLQRQFRDWRIGFLTIMLVLMTFRQCLTLYVQFDGWTIRSEPALSEIPGLLVSFMAVAVVHVSRIMFSDIAGRHERTTVHNKAIVAIATAGSVIRGELDETYRVVSETVASALHVERVSIWKFNDDRSALDCMGLYRGSQDVYEEGGELLVSQFPRYFEALETHRVMDAHDALTDLRTSEFRTDYLEPNNIFSMLDAPIRVHGELWGVVCHEQVGIARTWKSDEQSFAATVADQLAHVILTHEHREALDHEYELERQLLQSQKMESLGTLAGGIAHDFNNILQVILGHCSIADDDSIDIPDEVLEAISEIDKSGHRAADLVRQILTFSRKSEGVRVQVNLDTVFSEFLAFLRSTLPPSIIIDSDIALDGAVVLADPTQLHQIFSNISTNAFHAKEQEGGTLTITADPVHLDTRQESMAGLLEPDSYVRVSFGDNGVGIDKENINKIIEPFFTTKEVGKGTGLGLAVIHGLLKSMAGGLYIDSVLGEGTHVTLFIPTVDAETETPPDDEIPLVDLYGGGNVLIVDDEESIGQLLKAGLETKGFSALFVPTAEQCLSLPTTDLENFDVVVLDYMMPGMNGLGLAARLVDNYPDLPIILMSGLADASALHIDEFPNIRSVLHKPFTVTELSSQIGQLLGSPAHIDAP